MRCPSCNRKLEGDAQSCPYCGESVAARPLAMLKTSTILISSNNTESVYHSVREVPEPLRGRLLRSTSGLNARTILIADRRGQQEITRALRSLPGGSALSSPSDGPRTPSKLTMAHAAGILVAGASAVLAWLLLFRR